MALFGPLLLLIIYLIGSVPIGLLVARSKGVDITAVGSGNVGATNVARSVGKAAGVITLVGDVLKGVIGVLLGDLLFDTPWGGPIAACFVVAGHCFSVPPVLKGGKGVATALGSVLCLLPMAALICVVIFSAVFAATRIVSLASLFAVVAAPLTALVTGADDELSLCLMVVSAIIVYRHHANIDRLIKGNEPKFASRGK
jgi:acyl phosphate:glycerol-3-phosphate acyltransferase